VDHSQFLSALCDHNACRTSKTFKCPETHCFSPRGGPVGILLGPDLADSGDTTPCKMTGVTLHPTRGCIPRRTPPPILGLSTALESSGNPVPTHVRHLGHQEAKTRLTYIQGYLAHKKPPPPPQHHHRSLGMVLLKGPTGWRFLISEAALYVPQRFTQTRIAVLLELLEL